MGEIKVDQMASLTRADAEALIGKRIVGVEASEYSFTLRLDDGGTLKAHGSTYGGCALAVDYEPTAHDERIQAGDKQGGGR